MNNNMEKRESVIVSVFCLTYNHAEYIEDALKGFLRQKTDFEYNVFAFDDASTDGTSEILKGYQKKYPDMFNVYIAEENTYNSPNRNELLKRLYDKYLPGKYIAWCEGDDYWTDDNKLQIQVDYMESHPECSMTAHSSVWENFLNHTMTDYRPYKENRVITPEEIILKPNGNVSTASLVMKRDVFIRADGFPTCDVEDVPMQLSAISKGEVYYFDLPMSVYRYMHSGSWSKTVKKDIMKYLIHCYKMVVFLDDYDVYTGFKYSKYIKQLVKSYLYEAIYMNNQISICDFDKYYNSILDISYGKTKYIEQQKNIFELIKGQCVLDNALYLRKDYKHIVIMGAGEYSNYIKNTLDSHEISWVGYVISNEQKIMNKKEKAIWHLNEYPYDWEDTLVVVGINQNFESDIMRSLTQAGCKNYITPLWFDI